LIYKSSGTKILTNSYPSFVFVPITEDSNKKYIKILFYSNKDSGVMRLNISESCYYSQNFDPNHPNNQKSFALYYKDDNNNYNIIGSNIATTVVDDIAWFWLYDAELTD